MAAYLMPAQMEKHHEIIRHGKDGSLMLATNNLTGRYWRGSLWLFADGDAAPDIEHCSAGHEISAGICDMKIFERQKVVVSLDSGSLQVLDLTKYDNDKSKFGFVEVAEATEHDDLLYSISVSSNSQKVITGSWDRSIKIWDVQTFIPSYTYREAHSDIIWMVACHSKEPDMFASCSDDGEVRMWDTRLPRPALLLGERFDNCSPTAIAWKPDEGHLLMIGDELGALHSFDTRQNEFLHKEPTVHSRPFKAIDFSPTISNHLASCADESKLCAFNLTSGIPQQIYEDDFHSDYVRSLSWHPLNNKLYSCSWDGSVKSHIVTVTMETNS